MKISCTLVESLQGPAGRGGLERYKCMCNVHTQVTLVMFTKSFISIIKLLLLNDDT